ncbi:MAG TPA: hypothetical protein VMY37_09645 [Thermoguttaceae bacterium]|nr:hypothetical protein [Thermoguttaceae bacterium]
MSRDDAQTDAAATPPKRRRLSAFIVLDSAAVFQAIGGLITLVAVLLFLGNSTGAFPTFPLAGLATMTIGGAILAAVAYERNRMARKKATQLAQENPLTALLLTCQFLVEELPITDHKSRDEAKRVLRHQIELCQKLSNHRFPPPIGEYANELLQLVNDQYKLLSNKKLISWVHGGVNKELNAQHQDFQQRKLVLASKLLDAKETMCQECAAVIPADATSCPQCGWSYAADG